MAKLFRVLVRVQDIDAAAAFYGAVLGTAGRRVSPGRHYFDCEGTVLACYDPVADGDEDEPVQPAPLPEPLYLAVDDLESTFLACEKAGAGFPDASPPDVGPLGTIAERPWGEVSFYADDPFGNPLCFVRRGTEFT